MTVLHYRPNVQRITLTPKWTNTSHTSMAATIATRFDYFRCKQESRSGWISFDHLMAETDAEHCFDFISFDCCLDAHAALVT
jgi:hypothetical protein